MINKKIPFPLATLILAIAAAIIIAVVIYVCKPKPALSPTGPSDDKSLPKLTVEAVKNTKYKLPGAAGALRLTDGEYHCPPFDTGGCYLKIEEDRIAFGDLNNDSTEDAIVILGHWSGGSGYFLNLAVLINQDGQPENITTTGLGDRVQINAIEIQSGQIILEMLTHGPDDGLCCPSVTTVKKYKLSGDQLIEF